MSTSISREQKKCNMGDVTWVSTPKKSGRDVDKPKKERMVSRKTIME